MAQAHILGFPRMGTNRELKFALESFWRGDTHQQALEEVAADLRQRHWQWQQQAGLDRVTVGDFSYYDQMLDMSVLLGALPRRFGFDAARLSLTQYFELARGNAAQPAMEMTKWFDTNYHYLVPELHQECGFDGGGDALYAQVEQAMAGGMTVKPVLIGPVSYLWLSKTHDATLDRLSVLPALLAGYKTILQRLARMGVHWVQIDEPVLCLELDAAWLQAYEQAYDTLRDSGVKLLLTTYFDGVSEYTEFMSRLPVQGFHVDLVRAPEQLERWCRVLPASAVLSAGVVDGRNIWRADVRQIVSTLRPLQATLGDRLWIAPSCSLLHVPVSIQGEKRLDAELRSWLAGAVEKLDELSIIKQGLNGGAATVTAQLLAADDALASRRTSTRVHNDLVRQRMAGLTQDMAKRNSAFSERIAKQQETLNLPLLPTTTIGSFPQTSAIRQVRAQYKCGALSAYRYLQHMRTEIQHAVQQQEELGLDVLVHGEAERNDMVEYFGEQLWGYAFTQQGWVQSYGSRCVKPPILYGDVYRPEPMTVETSVYAQSLTNKWMKGMLTGPITMLQWSFVRDDQPRSETAKQLALAIRDEVADLEQAGIRIIQIDEPALREGLPLKKVKWLEYLSWAVYAFRLASAGVSDETQIHTHMCYAEFNDILPSIAAMDADVMTIETSRSNMELLEGFRAFAYPNEIGPGVYDIHSPRVPDVAAMVRMLERACDVIPIQRLWVNPDCGLKTRGWAETRAALANMVAAAQVMRERVHASQDMD